jgi:hypothetical protein
MRHFGYVFHRTAGRGRRTMLAELVEITASGSWRVRRFGCGPEFRLIDQRHWRIGLRCVGCCFLSREERNAATREPT